MAINNFYGNNPSNPWLVNGIGAVNNTAGQINQNNLQAQTPGYAGFNNFQRPPMASMMPGRIVANADEIMPQEVPMDGSVSLFLQNDGSCIYAKTWTKDGTIQTIRFVPELPQTGDNQQKSPLEMRLDSIDQKLDSMTRQMFNRPRNYQKRNNNQSKKKEEAPTE